MKDCPFCNGYVKIEDYGFYCTKCRMKFIPPRTKGDSDYEFRRKSEDLFNRRNGLLTPPPERRIAAWP